LPRPILGPRKPWYRFAWARTHYSPIRGNWPLLW